MHVNAGAASTAESRVANAWQSRRRQSYRHDRAASTQVPPSDNTDDAAASRRAEGHVEPVRRRHWRHRRRSHIATALQHHGYVNASC